jgi:hypothetical protein
MALSVLLKFVSSLKGEDISLVSLPAYENARPCLQSCLNGGVGCGGACGPHWGDPMQAVACSRNYCLCRPDLQETIYSALTACMDNSCNNQLELSSVVSIFSGYCDAYYATAPPYPTLPSTSSTSIILTPTVEPTLTPEITPTPASQTPTTVTQTLTAQSTVVVFRSSSSTPFSNSESAHLYLSEIAAFVALFTINMWF